MVMGGGWNAVVVSTAFEGQNMLKQHRLVYGALGVGFDTDALHALSLKTLRPRRQTAAQPPGPD